VQVASCLLYIKVKQKTRQPEILIQNAFETKQNKTKLQWNEENNE
jgi:hypothetical protein